MSKKERAQDFAEKHGEMIVYLINDFTQVEYHKKDGTFLKWSEGVAEVFLGELNSAGEKIKCSMSLSKQGIWIPSEERVDIDQIREALAFYDAIYNLSPLEKAKDYIESLEGPRSESIWIDEDAKHSLRVGYQDGSINSNSFVFHQDSGEIRLHSGRCEPSVRLDKEGGITFFCASHLDVNDLQELINFWKAIYE